MSVDIGTTGLSRNEQADGSSLIVDWRELVEVQDDGGVM
jgi:hypothetical protein